MSKSHLFLKNEFGISRIFNRTREREMIMKKLWKTERIIVIRGRIFIAVV